MSGSWIPVCAGMTTMLQAQSVGTPEYITRSRVHSRAHRQHDPLSMRHEPAEEVTLHGADVRERSVLFVQSQKLSAHTATVDPPAHTQHHPLPVSHCPVNDVTLHGAFSSEMRLAAPQSHRDCPHVATVCTCASWKDSAGVGSTEEAANAREYQASSSTRPVLILPCMEKQRAIFHLPSAISSPAHMVRMASSISISLRRSRVYSGISVPAIRSKPATGISRLRPERVLVIRTCVMLWVVMSA